MCFNFFNTGSYPSNAIHKKKYIITRAYCLTQVNQHFKYRGLHGIHGSRIAFMDVNARRLFHDIENACWYTFGCV